MSSSKLKGPRPAPLMVGVDSHKVQKPAKKPVIIYMVAPEIIHVEAGEFMSLVQRLTGPNSPSSREIRKLTTSANNDLQSADKDKHRFPVKVKARTINRPASSSGMKLQQSSPQSPISPTLFFHDLSPISRGGGGGALKEGAAASQGWSLHHHADFLGNGLSSSGGGLGSPNFLDIFGPLPPPQS